MMISRSKAVKNLSYFWRPNSWICFQRFIIKAVNNLSYFMKTLPQQSRGTVEGKRRSRGEVERGGSGSARCSGRIGAVHRERERERTPPCINRCILQRVAFRSTEILIWRKGLSEIDCDNV